MTTDRISRTIAAEARAVEEGHRAFLDGSKIKVVSDSTEGLHWMVTATANSEKGSPIAFRCVPSDYNLAAGRGHLDRTDQGALPCKHAGVAVRRLERDGLAYFDPRHGWCVTAKAAAQVAERFAKTQPEDPFDRL